MDVIDEEDDDDDDRTPEEEEEDEDDEEGTGVQDDCAIMSCGPATPSAGLSLRTIDNPSTCTSPSANEGIARSNRGSCTMRNVTRRGSDPFVATRFKNHDTSKLSG